MSVGLVPGPDVHQDHRGDHLHGPGLVAQARHRAALPGRAQEHEPYKRCQGTHDQLVIDLLIYLSIVFLSNISI